MTLSSTFRTFFQHHLPPGNTGFWTCSYPFSPNSNQNFIPVTSDYWQQYFRDCYLFYDTKIILKHQFPFILRKQSDIIVFHYKQFSQVLTTEVINFLKVENPCKASLPILQGNFKEARLVRFLFLFHSNDDLNKYIHIIFTLI